MLREQFIGRNPTHFVSNSIVRAFITSEIFLWSGWDAVVPLLAIFVVKNVPGGNIELAASAYSIYLVTRVIFELISGKRLARSPESSKIYAALFGLVFASIACIGFAFVNYLPLLFLCYGVAGLGIGIASPAKNSLFSTHLDKNKEATQWGIYDAAVLVCIALSTALAGFIATAYGFRTLFVIAGLWILVGTIPYLLYLRKT